MSAVGRDPRARQSGMVEIRRRLPAPVDEVFRWWTEPEFLCQWITPRGLAEVEVDLRPGGGLRVVMRDAVMEIEHRGTYLEIDPPRRLVFTWTSPYSGVEPGVVTVELTPDGDATLLSLTHDRLPGAAAESHEGGWNWMLDRLDGLIARGRS